MTEDRVLYRINEPMTFSDLQKRVQEATIESIEYVGCAQLNIWLKTSGNRTFRFSISGDFELYGGFVFCHSQPVFCKEEDLSTRREEVLDKHRGVKRIRGR